jgi:hypothetical protein
MLVKICALLTVVLVYILFSCRNNVDTYNYSEENPNALQTGKKISGAVYSDYPSTIPGLGWIL